MAKEEARQPKSARAQTAWENLTHPPSQRSKIRPTAWKRQASLSLSLCIRKQEHLTTTTQRINPSCKMPARHVWRFVACVCYSRLISAWRYTGTKHGVMLWRSDNSLTRPKRRGEKRHAERRRDRERNDSERIGRGSQKKRGNNRIKKSGKSERWEICQKKKKPFIYSALWAQPVRRNGKYVNTVS